MCCLIVRLFVSVLGGGGGSLNTKHTMHTITVTINAQTYVVNKMSLRKFEYGATPLLYE